MKENKMTTFEKAKAIRSLIISRTVQSITYIDSWGQDFAMKQILEIPEIVKGWEKKDKVSFTIDPYELSLVEMSDLGFGTWDDSGLQLIPLWLYPYLPENIKTVSISGNEYHSKKDIDTDSRAGVLAYGIYKN